MSVLLPDRTCLLVSVFVLCVKFALLEEGPGCKKLDCPTCKRKALVQGSSMICTRCVYLRTYVPTYWLN